MRSGVQAKRSRFVQHDGVCMCCIVLLHSAGDGHYHVPLVGGGYNGGGAVREGERLKNVAMVKGLGFRAGANQGSVGFRVWALHRAVRV